jgi:hypothetical protein
LNTRWLRLSGKVAAGALTYGTQHGVDCIFCGHTHVAMQAERNGIRYYNSGSWIDGSRCTYITVGRDGVGVRTFAPEGFSARPQEAEQIAPEPEDEAAELPANAFYRPVREPN